MRMRQPGRLQGAKELQKSVLFTRFEPFKLFGDMFGFAVVAEDGVQKSDRSTIVHEARVQTDTPERGRTDLIAGAVDVGEAIRAGLVIRLAYGVAQVGDFVGLEAASDAHFVEIGVSRERQKAGVLVFPAEAANGGLAGGLENGNVEDLTANLFVVFLT